MAKPTLDTKILIKNFESGDIQSEKGPLSPTEKAPGRPGATKKLVKNYENKNQGSAQAAPTAAAVKKQSSVSIPEWVDDKVESEIKLKVLIVFCHMDKRSFNGQLLNMAVDTLQKGGHEVAVSDLYEMKFNPLPSREDILGDPDDKGAFNYLHEGGVAAEKGTLAQDILAEQQKVKDADLVVFQFPLNWGAMPTMLKGWVDRVMQRNFAFGGMALFDNGLMKEKKALLSITCGGMESFYTNRGIMGDINAFLWPIQNGLLRFCGFEVLPPHIVYGVSESTFTQKRAKQAIKAWQIRLHTIALEPPMAFVPLSEFDETLQLKGEGPKLINPDGSEGKGFGPTIGQNMGKPFPADGQVRFGLQIVSEKLPEPVKKQDGQKEDAAKEVKKDAAKEEKRDAAKEEKKDAPQEVKKDAAKKKKVPTATLR